MLKRLVSFLLGLAVLSPLAVVWGQSGTNNAELNWLPPTTCTDGSAVILTEQRIYRETNGSGVFGLIDTIGGGLTSYIDGPLFNGDYCYHLTAVGQCGAGTVTLESDPSAEACKIVNLPGNDIRPLSQTGLTVQ